MPELTGVAFFAKRLDVICTGFATGKSRNDVIQFKTLCGTATPARRTKKMSVLFPPKFLGRWVDVECFMEVQLAFDAAKVKPSRGAVAHNIEVDTASRARNGQSPAIGDTVAGTRAVLAVVVGEHFLSDLELLSARLARGDRSFSSKDGSTGSGARRVGPLSKMARRFVELAGTHCAGLVGGFLVPSHRIGHL